jgi:hypothetical protein
LSSGCLQVHARAAREGKAIGRQLAMTQGEDARLAVLNELLDASPDT